MKKMLQIAYKFLEKNKSATFNQIFEEIKKELKVYWKEDNPTVLLTKIEEDKIGTLYTYLTTDGRFIMLGKNKWTISSVLTTKELLAAKSRVIIESPEDL